MQVGMRAWPAARLCLACPPHITRAFVSKPSPPCPPPLPRLQASVDHVSRLARVLDPQPKIGAHGNPVVFLHPKDMAGVLVELEEVR